MAQAADPILPALAAEERAGIRLATIARLDALAIIGLWVATRAVGPAGYYYLSIIALFALIGLGQLLLSRRPGRGARVAAYGLTLLDMVVLTIALVVPNPMAPEGWPAAMQLRLGNFDFFYVFIGLAVLGFSPALAHWAGIAAAAAWSAGILWGVRPRCYGPALRTGSLRIDPRRASLRTKPRGPGAKHGWRLDRWLAMRRRSRRSFREPMRTSSGGR
jgi:adenylate cyclase